MAPFILDAEVPEGMRDELDRILPVIRKLADEFADAYIPLDEIFAFDVSEFRSLDAWTDLESKYGF
jgi:hypothetical protein